MPTELSPWAEGPRVVCGWPPARKDFSGVSAVRSLAVMCPACVRGRWPQALMGSVDRGLIKPAGSRCPMSRYRFASIRRSTDAAITLFHPRKLPLEPAPTAQVAAGLARNSS